MPEWLFTSDLHGQGALYEQLGDLVAHRHPRAVIIGGDLGPHAPGEAGVRRQRLFLQGFLVEFARRLGEASPGTDLLLLMGNDDWAANLDCLDAQDGRLWHHIHGRTVQVDGVPVTGLSWVPITPFGGKDWERWDDGEPETPARLDGWISRAGRLEPFRFDPLRRRPTIAEALAALDPAPASGGVLVAHSPPHGTRCDQVAAGRHVGSRALRTVVERRQPAAVLSGHIHESPRVTGHHDDRIGASVIVNPGQFGSPGLCGVWFDPGEVAGSLRHTVFAPASD